ncbi:hypothetical protein [Halovenus halobia]|uniref:hypothetical protein n=1 Tax=Halovenus halobia TaxID=3396622 RepID=UPI003F572194
MTTTASTRLERVQRDLRDRGFSFETAARPTVARDGPADFAGVDAPLDLRPLASDRPLEIISAVANAAHDGRVPVLVVDDHDYDTVQEFLSPPFALAGNEDGVGQFYTIEDRIQLTDDSFACVASPGELSWSEAPDAGSDSPPLRLSVGGETAAVLDSVEGLACPGPSPAAFRHRYARGEDGRFRVYEGDSVVGEYTGVTAMRQAGVRPVPLPLVPEHHVRNNGDLARAVMLATVEDGTVQYTG